MCFACNLPGLAALSGQEFDIEIPTLSLAAVRRASR
jgi:hypothetical protein